MRKKANSPDMTAINVLQGMRPRGSSVEMHTFLPFFGIVTTARLSFPISQRLLTR
jgi:hypothetical protein